MIAHSELLILGIGAIAAFISAVVDTIAGGGGLITLPVLLLLGLSPQAALGTNKLQAVFGSGTAAYKFFRYGGMTFKELLPGIIYTFIGASVGTVAVIWMNPNHLKKFIPYLLAVALIYMLLAPQKKLEAGQKACIKLGTFLLLSGLILGFYDGFFGPGTGSLWCIAMMFFVGFPLTKATMHTKVYNFTSNLFSLLWFVCAGHYFLWLGLIMGVAQSFGAMIGAHLVMGQGSKIIKPVFIVMVTVMIIALWWQG